MNQKLKFRLALHKYNTIRIRKSIIFKHCEINSKLQKTQTNNIHPQSFPNTNLPHNTNWWLIRGCERPLPRPSRRLSTTPSVKKRLNHSDNHKRRDIDPPPKDEDPEGYSPWVTRRGWVGDVTGPPWPAPTRTPNTTRPKNPNMSNVLKNRACMCYACVSASIEFQWDLRGKNHVRFALMCVWIASCFVNVGEICMFFVWIDNCWAYVLEFFIHMVRI